MINKYLNFQSQTKKTCRSTQLGKISGIERTEVTTETMRNTYLLHINIYLYIIFCNK